MKKINFCKATTIILIINVILSIVLFFVVPDKIAIQWVGTSPSNAVDSYYVFLVPVLSVLFAFTGKPIFTMFLFRLWNRTNEHLVTYLNLCLQVVFLTYCRDISVKTRSALEVKRRSGDFVGAFTIYGYVKVGDKHKSLFCCS